MGFSQSDRSNCFDNYSVSPQIKPQAIGVDIMVPHSQHVLHSAQGGEEEEAEAAEGADPDYSGDLSSDQEVVEQADPDSSSSDDEDLELDQPSTNADGVVPPASSGVVSPESKRAAAETRPDPARNSLALAPHAAKEKNREPVGGGSTQEAKMHPRPLTFQLGCLPKSCWDVGSEGYRR
jgi:hypothetical protein